MNDPDPSLSRFVEAQDGVWHDVLSQLRAGHKTSHWMWFVFPQLSALGRSSTARFYGLRDLHEAQAYLRHPLLGPRLVACCELLRGLAQDDPVSVFGAVDALKLRSCLTLFATAAPGQAVFGDCLQKFFGGAPDELSLALLGESRR
jgi:uncharacterized protein (DUF1810 family)